jgi:hypothetical protein
MSGDPSSAVFDLESSLIPGLDPVDWSTLEIKDFTVYISDYESSVYDCSNVAGAGVWGTEVTTSLMGLMKVDTKTWNVLGAGVYTGTVVTLTVSDDGAGQVTVEWAATGTIPPLDVFFRVKARVADDQGKYGNCFTLIAVPGK